MKKIFIILLCIISISSALSACSWSKKIVMNQSTDSKASIYDWPCPIDGIEWGISKEEFLHYYKWKTDAYNEEKTSEALTRLYPNKKFKIYGYNATLSFDFDNDYGLTQIFIHYDDKNVNSITKILSKKFRDGSESGSSPETREKTWNGSVLKDLDTSLTDKYQSYMQKLGVPQDRIDGYMSLPLVVMTWDIGSSSQFYCVYRISANRAALLERLLKE